MRQLNGASSDRSSTTLDENSPTLYRTRDMNSTMSRNSGDAETSSLLQWHAFGKWHGLLERNYRVFGSGPERTITLSAVAPHTPTDPFPRHSIADRINRSRTVAVWYDAWIRHPDAKRILAFLDVTGIYARKGDSNPNFACAWLWIVHFADDQHVPRSALLLVPSGFHEFKSSHIKDSFRIAMAFGIVRPASGQPLR